MANRNSTAPTGAESLNHAPASVPDLSNVQAAIDDESNAARLLHRFAMDLRENLPDGAAFPDHLRADVDALTGELGRLELRLTTLAGSLDVAGGPRLVEYEDGVVLLPPRGDAFRVTLEEYPGECLDTVAKVVSTLTGEATKLAKERIQFLPAVLRGRCTRAEAEYALELCTAAGARATLAGAP